MKLNKKNFKQLNRKINLINSIKINWKIKFNSNKINWKINQKLN